MVFYIIDLFLSSFTLVVTIGFVWWLYSYFKLVLDPFCGSMTTVKVSERFNRQFVGYDTHIYWQESLRVIVRNFWWVLIRIPISFRIDSCCYSFQGIQRIWMNRPILLECRPNILHKLNNFFCSFTSSSFLFGSVDILLATFSSSSIRSSTSSLDIPFSLMIEVDPKSRTVFLMS